jgi:phosphate uptake regulator
MEVHKRRIQSFAKYSFAITLPVHWIKKNHLIREKSKSKSKKDLENDPTVNIYENPDGSLSIYPAKVKAQEKGKKFTIELDEYLKQNPNFIKDKAIQMILISYYMNGATRVEILSQKQIQREFIDQIEDILNRLLLNWNLNRESNYKLYIENALTESPENIIQERIPQYLKESFSRLLWMIDDILVAIKEKDYKNLTNIKEQDMKIDRYYFFIVRQIRTIFDNAQISKPLHFNHKKLVDLRLLAKFIEDIGDNLKDVAEIIYNLHEFLKDIDINDYLVNYFTILQEIYDELLKQLKKNVVKRESPVGMNPEIMKIIQDARKKGNVLEQDWKKIASKVEILGDRYTFIEYYDGARLIQNLREIFTKIFDFTNLFF